jgi:hypothetical protein
MINDQEIETQAIYLIKVKGILNQTWSDWFDGFAITVEVDQTILVGPVADQANLQGILMKINNLNLPLLLVKRLAGTNMEENENV